MLGHLLGMVLLWTILPESAWEGKGIASSVIVLATFFGPGLLISWLMTMCYCRSAVICPHCRASLWSCGSGNFKARKVKVVADRCPGCEAWIV